MVLEEVLPAVRERGVWEGDLAFRNFATGAEVPVHYTVFPSATHTGLSPATAPSSATSPIDVRRMTELGPTAG